MKWNVSEADGDNNGHHLGRGCQKCTGSGSDCKCGTGGITCQGADKCQCAKEGKCCKCCCTNCTGKCKKECICYKEEKTFGRDEYNRDSYMSAYPSRTVYVRKSYIHSERSDAETYWKDVISSPDRHQCARIFLGSVCLIWSGVTYMYWTGKWDKRSQRWNNHILDGTGLDDGTLSQWLQALGFPREMLNNKGPENRMDQFYLGFADTSNHSGGHGQDSWDNSFRSPAGLNIGGFIHAINKGAFDSSVFKGNGNDSKIDTNKLGALFKLYILSCAYFTGLQKKASTQTTTSTTSRNPKTIREVLYWLSALPYNPAYKDMLTYAKEKLKEVTKKPGDNGNDTPKLSFIFKPGAPPFTVERVNIYAHFQAVTQYCPLVLIGIQGGLHSTTKGTDSTKEPPIHALYANTACHFTYPTVDIQAYNQVVHYIRGLFYQLYFLRKQCAVKVTCGGKWRECRYGSGVLGKDVVSWMCLGCNPMEHDRKSRVGKLGTEILKGVKGGDAEKIKELLLKIGDVVVQLGNAQEVLEKDIGNVNVAVTALKKVTGVKNGGDLKGVLEAVLKVVETKVKELETEVGKKDDGETSQAISKATKALEEAKSTVQSDGDKKNEINAAHHGLQKVLEILKMWLKGTSSSLDDHKNALLDATSKLKDICNFPKCPGCKDHSTKCGKKPVSKYCDKCHQQYMDGTPSPLQAFLEDRLPGFSCREVPQDENPEYPLASSHLGHCNGSGQCCPLPMGFRNNFYKGSTSDCTGARLYGILYFFSNENMMQSCVYTLVRVTAALSATTPQVLGDVFGFFRGGVGNPVQKEGESRTNCDHGKDPKTSTDPNSYFCGWCASGLRDVVKQIEWIPKTGDAPYRDKVGDALINIKGDKGTGSGALKSSATPTTTNLSTLTDSNHYVSPLTGELYTAVSATFGGTYLSWVLYLSDALQWGLESLASEFKQIECRGCKGNCDPNKCKKGEHGRTTGNTKGTPLCTCQSIVSCTGVLPVLYRHGFSYGNPFNLEGYQQRDGKTEGDYSIDNKQNPRRCHQFLESLNQVIQKKEEADQKGQDNKHPLTELLTQVGQLQYDIRLPWIFVLTVAWLVAVLYLAFGAIWPLDWTHMRSHWLRGGAHQWQCMWYKVMTGRKGMELVEYFGRR